MKYIFIYQTALWPHSLTVTENGIIRTDEIESVMKRVDRGKYVSHNPYMDVPQGIGYGVTISAPHMVNTK